MKRIPLQLLTIGLICSGAAQVQASTLDSQGRAGSGFQFDSNTFTNLPGSGDTALFSVTPRNGQITDWSLLLSTPPPVPKPSGPTTNPSTGRPPPSTESHDVSSPPNPGKPPTTSSVQTPAVKAPELDPSTTFSALTLLIGCLAVLMGHRRKPLPPHKSGRSVRGTSRTKASRLRGRSLLQVRDHAQVRYGSSGAR